MEDFPLFSKDKSEEDIIGMIENYKYDLLGSSEYYLYRVVEDCSVFYLPEDIIAEEIKFQNI